MYTMYPLAVLRCSHANSFIAARWNTTKFAFFFYSIFASTMKMGKTRWQQHEKKKCLQKIGVYSAQTRKTIFRNTRVCRASMHIKHKYYANTTYWNGSMLAYYYASECLALVTILGVATGHDAIKEWNPLVYVVYRFVRAYSARATHTLYIYIKSRTKFINLLASNTKYV